jgi:hypothetical protein
MLGKNNLKDLLETKNQLDKLIDNIISPNSHEMESEDSKKSDGVGPSYGVRAMKRATGNNSSLEQSSGKKRNNLSQSMMILPSESKQPKALMNKYQHLMKDT